MLINCNRQAGRQAGSSRGDSSFCGQEEGGKTGLYWEGRLNLFISSEGVQKRINEKLWQQNDQKMPFEIVYFIQSGVHVPIN
jgi:hypothetical protein